MKRLLKKVFRSFHSPSRSHALLQASSRSSSPHPAPLQSSTEPLVKKQDVGFGATDTLLKFTKEAAEMLEDVPYVKGVAGILLYICLLDTSESIYVAAMPLEAPPARLIYLRATLYAGATWHMA